MVSMITCHLQGGLGNQLFQIFATIAYALRHDKQFKFLYKCMLGNRSTYWETFLLPLKYFTVIQLPKMTAIKEKGFEYHALHMPLHDNENIELYGYFQSYKYFDTYFPQICRMIRLEKQQHKLLAETFTLICRDTSISMHFRLGDYKQLSEYHPVLPVEYYKNSIRRIVSSINTEITVLYFCEVDDMPEIMETRIIPLQLEFPECRFVNAAEYVLEDWRQLLLMSLCDHHIIANSSFSWWGAYLSNYKDKDKDTSSKIICYPDQWFGPKLQHYNTRDLFPESWTQINIL